MPISAWLTGLVSSRVVHRCLVLVGVGSASEDRPASSAPASAEKRRSRTGLRRGDCGPWTTVLRLPLKLVMSIKTPPASCILSAFVNDFQSLSKFYSEARIWHFLCCALLSIELYMLYYLHMVLLEFVVQETDHTLIGYVESLTLVKNTFSTCLVNCNYLCMI